VSHDPRWKEFADRTITLSDGQIQIKQEEQRNNS
jgi:ABC-type lipoprotein export system ATPase subunit